MELNVNDVLRIVGPGVFDNELRGYVCTDCLKRYYKDELPQEASDQQGEEFLVAFFEWSDGERFEWMGAYPNDLPVIADNGGACCEHCGEFLIKPNGTEDDESCW